LFSIKNREPLISDDWCDELFRVLGGTVNNLDCQSLIAGGLADHVQTTLIERWKQSRLKTFGFSERPFQGRRANPVSVSDRIGISGRGGHNHLFLAPKRLFHQPRA
jgi:hypothetical protein